MKRDPNTIVVTATRRSQRLQDVPMSVTAFSQAELTQKGIVGFEGIARETPGVVLDAASDNNLSLTARGISTNGYRAGLQTTTTVYLDELPLTTIGNTVTLDPNLYDVERVEFLRGPQGTLFGSGSLSGALRILTTEPGPHSTIDTSALADIGWTPDGGGIRQRYNAHGQRARWSTTRSACASPASTGTRTAMSTTSALGIKNSNRLEDSGGRAILLWKPTDRLSIRLMGLYENSHPQDASLVTPSLGDRKRYTIIPDLYTSKTQLYNATIDYQFGFAHLTSSTSYAHQDGNFDVDLAGTFAGTGPIQNAIPFLLYDHGIWKTFVQETRLVSAAGHRFDWTVGGYYLHRDLFLDGRETVDPGLPGGASYHRAAGRRDVRQIPAATPGHTSSRAYGELTFNATAKLALTGGLRYGKYGATVDTFPGFNSQYFIYALFGISGPLAIVPTAATTTHFPSAREGVVEGEHHL